MIRITNIEVATEVHRLGKDTDGQGILVEKYFVVAQFENGDLHVHLSAFQGWEIEETADGGVVLLDTRESAKARAELVCRRAREIVSAGDGLDLSMWRFYRRTYVDGAENR